MGKRYSGRRPEDKPAYIRPEMLDFEKRRILFTSVPPTVQNIITNIISDEDKWTWDGGSSLISVTDSVSIIYDLGGSA